MEKRTVTFNGETYVQQPNGYYFKYTTRNAERRHAKQLHRAVWEFYNGPIPDGYHIHHVDGNKDNNDISNLECISAKEHLSMHSKKLMQDPERRQKNRQHLSKIQELAKEWHSSDEGMEWHRKHTAESIAKAWEKVERTCTVCGKKYIATARSHYCSQLCERHAREARRGHIVRGKVRQCVRCGKTFEATNGIQSYCSRDCQKASEWERRKAKIAKERESRPPIKRICVQCGTEFEPTGTNQKYCSKSCRDAAYRER